MVMMNLVATGLSHTETSVLLGTQMLILHLNLAGGRDISTNPLKRGSDSFLTQGPIHSALKSINFAELSGT